MEIAAALAPLDRVVSQYRRDVNHLPSGAPPDALTALEGHLNRRLPPGLRQFLTLHNGAHLFRGQLRIRATSEVAVASETVEQVVLFADTHDEVRWAWALESAGAYVFGTWDGERMAAQHTTFGGWLAACIAEVETRVTRRSDIDDLRFEADSDDVIQQIRAGGRALESGSPQRAEDLLRKATEADPSRVQGWQFLGDALAISDRSAARVAWLRAFRRIRLPLAWPGAACLDPSVFNALSAAFTNAETWEGELATFLKDNVRDVVNADEAGVVVGAGRALARSLMSRGRRLEARGALADLIGRCHTFSHAFTPWDALIELAWLEVGLGHYDEAEALVRRLRTEGPAELRGRGLLIVAAITVTRQEPWAEDILNEAGEAGLDEVDQVKLALLRIERGVRQERFKDADRLVEEAARQARRIGLPALEAAVGLAEGDLFRLGRAYDRATACYDRATALVADRDPELRSRIRLRMGDLALAQRDLPAAEAHFRMAAAGFAAQELPVREAWALLRLARIARDDNRVLIKAARERFTRADLAVGVAALDSVAGDPGASLDWHLKRASMQARARHDAQRSRLPWTRADADRPERRLGGHRLAIAACGLGVVQTLAVEMDARARAASTGRGHAKDPDVLGYVGAVDLLSGHRSFEAAKILLDHLLEQRVDGVAYRALQGAIARSPNAALVDGLMKCIERPNASPGHAVAAAADLLGMRREPAAVRALMNLADAKNRPLARRAAISALGRIGNRHAVHRVAEALQEPSLAETAALSLLLLGDRRGIDFHGRALVEHRTDLSGHPGEIVGRYGGPDHLILLQNAADGTDDMALGALQGLGLMGDPRGVPTLMNAIASRDRRVSSVAFGSMQILTGHEEDLDTPGAKNRWKAWWETNKGAFPEGTRHREGKIFDCGFLIERMSWDDAWVRRTAYDELVIASGCDLPYDADGPWRVQCAHLEKWKRWWGKTRHTHVSGRWYLDGKQIH